MTALRCDWRFIGASYFDLYLHKKGIRCVPSAVDGTQGVSICGSHPKAIGNARLWLMKCFNAVLTMVAAGASILLPLGGANAQSSELPDGPGKAFAMENCTGCHGPELITAQRRSPDEWRDVVNRMIANGDALTEDEYNKVVTYLETYLGKAVASGAVPASPSVASHTSTAPGTVAR